MNILIRGMEMPKNCGSCPLRASCVNRIYLERRPDYCPLVEVPPHGDLIDRDALSKSLNKLCERVCQYSKAQRAVMCSSCPLGDAFAVVEDDAQAVIEAEVE